MVIVGRGDALEDARGGNGEGERSTLLCVVKVALLVSSARAAAKEVVESRSIFYLRRFIETYFDLMSRLFDE